MEVAAKLPASLSLSIPMPEASRQSSRLAADLATWLKEELTRRFPGVPVRYVIYSHSHWDHIEGGGLFAGTAQFIAQEGVLRNMDGRYPHMPGDMIDRNNNGQFESRWISSVPKHKRIPECAECPASFFQSHDLQTADGHMTPAELYTRRCAVRTSCTRNV